MKAKNAKSAIVTNSLQIQQTHKQYNRDRAVPKINREPEKKHIGLFFYIGRRKICQNFSRQQHENEINNLTLQFQKSRVGWGNGRIDFFIQKRQLRKQKIER
jgi:hypothetical protein